MKRALFAAVVASLFGCATPFYVYDGKRYNTKEEFHQAVDSMTAAVVADIQPLPRAASSRSLTFGIPSFEAIHIESRRRFIATNNREPNGTEAEIIENLSASNYKNLRVFGDALSRRNVYRSVQVVALASVNASPEPSDATDVLYFVEPAAASGQWFYATAKHGKQVFSYDRSPPTPTGKVKAFVDAAQLQAIRD